MSRAKFDYVFFALPVQKIAISFDFIYKFYHFYNVC